MRRLGTVDKAIRKGDGYIERRDDTIRAAAVARHAENTIPGKKND